MRSLIKRQAPTKSFPLFKSPSIPSNILHLDPTYTISPSALQITSSNYLVPSLTISNPCASITWRSPIDLRTLTSSCLRDLIDLGKDHIQVYPNSSPKIGTELNKPCIVTFFKAVDMEKCRVGYGKIMKGLKMKAKRMGVELLSFDSESGEVKIRVQHFTKYSVNIEDLLDDEKEDKKDDFVEVGREKEGSKSRSKSGEKMFKDVQIQPVMSRKFFRHKEQMNEKKSQPVQEERILDSSKFMPPSGLFNNTKPALSSFDHNKDKKVSESNPFQTIKPFKSTKTTSQSTPGLVKPQNAQKLFSSIPIPSSKIDKKTQKISQKQFFKNIKHMSSIIPCPLETKTTYQQAELIKTIIKTPKNFEGLKNLIVYQKRIPDSIRQILHLAYILFNPYNTFILYKNGNIIETNKTQPLQNSIKDWFEVRMHRQQIHSVSQNIQLLLRRKVPELIRKYNKPETVKIVEIVSKLEDKAFLNLFRSSITNIPKEIAIILEQVHLEYLKKQSWITRMAANVIYGKSSGLGERIWQVLAKAERPNKSDGLLFAVLDMYAGMCLGNEREKEREKDKRGGYSLSVDNLIIRWYLSNVMKEYEVRGFRDKEEYEGMRHRLLKSLLLKITDNDTKVRILRFDNSLSEDQRVSLLTTTLIPNEYADLDLTTLEGVLSYSCKQKLQNKHFQSLQTLCSSPLTSQLSSTQQQLQKYFLKSLLHPETKQQYIKMIAPFVPNNPILRFFQLYFNIEENNITFDMDVLSQLFNYAIDNKGDKFTKRVEEMMLKGVMAHGTYFREVFRDGKEIKMYEYLVDVARKREDMKTEAKLKSWSVRI